MSFSQKQFPYLAIRNDTNVERKRGYFWGNELRRAAIHFPKNSPFLKKGPVIPEL
jgi:hypothetical protein